MDPPQSVVHPADPNQDLDGAPAGNGGSSNAQSANTSPLLLSSASSTSTNRKGRYADPDISNAAVERSSVSVSIPPSGQLGLGHHALKSTPSSPSAQAELVLRPTQSNPTDADKTPTLEATKMPPAGSQFRLPDPALIPPRSQDGDAESTRLSFSSLYSIGSVVLNGTGTSSIAGSESECKFQYHCISAHTCADKSILSLAN